MLTPTPRLCVLLLLSAAVTLQAQDPGRISKRPSSLQVAAPDADEGELRMTPVVRAVQRTADSVVSISVQAPHALAGRAPVQRGQGSGVILDESGLVITNWHVIYPVLAVHRDGSEYTVQVKLRDGRARPARVLSQSETHDLALLQIQLSGEEKVQPAEIGRSSTLMIGETVIAIGNPQGHAHTVTTGVLSATDRTIKVRAPDGKTRAFSQLMQTDAAINQGNSGGALLDITGKLVGINNAMAVGAENIGFAIPMDVVREVFETELVRSASFAIALDAPWLGLEVVERGDQLVITSVLRDGPAGRAGIEAGDILISVRDQPLRTSLDYQRLVVSSSEGEKLPLEVRRGEQKLAFAPVAATRMDWILLRTLGCELEELTADVDEKELATVTEAFYRRPPPRGMLVAGALRVKAVAEDSPSSDLLEPGDTIFAIVVRDPWRMREQELPVMNRRTLHEQLRARYGRVVKLAFLRDGQSYYASIAVRALSRR